MEKKQIFINIHHTSRVVDDEKIKRGIENIEAMIMTLKKLKL